MRSHLSGRAAAPVAAVLVVVVAASGLAPAASHEDPGGDCGPRAPIATYDGNPAEDPGRLELGRRFAFGYFTTQLVSPPDAVDSDADGSPDRIDNPSPTLAVTSGRGTVRFSHDGQVLWAGGVGDIDGVPGEEIGVWASTPGGLRSSVADITDAWIVPGATPPGDVDPAVVGTAIGTSLPSFSPDRDGDGVADLILVDYAAGDLLSGSSSVLSGAAVAAAGPGSAAPASATLLRLPGVVFGFARLDAPAGELEGIENIYQRDGDIITLQAAGDDVVLRLARGGAITSYALRLDPPASGGGPPVLFAWQGDTADYLSFTYNRADTGLARTALWEVGECDDATPTPTTSPEAPTTTITSSVAPPPAPPAAPVTDTARFTG